MTPLDAARAMAADCLCFRARRAARAITRAYDTALRPIGLQATQVTLMNVIALGPDGAQPMGRLSDILALEISTLTRNLRALEKAGLVEIGRSATDRRVRVVRLTEAGKTRLAGALPLWKQAHGRIVAALGDETARALQGALDSASLAMADFRQEAGPGVADLDGDDRSARGVIVRNSPDGDRG